MQKFSDKVALVTGGTTGIGLKIAEFFAREGATVCICGRSLQKGRAALEILKASGLQVSFIHCDISDSKAVKNMIAQIVREHRQLNYAVNNAGISARRGLLADSSETDWQDVININLTGTYLCMKYEIRQMLKNGGGAIVNNSSGAGLVPYPGQAAYIAGKFGVCGLTRAAAIEYANTEPSVRINAIAPGPILTGMSSAEKSEADPERAEQKLAATAMKRFGKPEEVAAAVLWLCSAEAGYITGTVLPVDGGYQAGKW